MSATLTLRSACSRTRPAAPAAEDARFAAAVELMLSIDQTEKRICKLLDLLDRDSAEYLDLHSALRMVESANGLIEHHAPPGAHVEMGVRQGDSLSLFLKKKHAGEPISRHLLAKARKAAQSLCSGVSTLKGKEEVAAKAFLGE